MLDKNSRDPKVDIFRLLMASLVLATHFLNPFVGFSFYAFGTGGFFIAAGYFCFANPQHCYSNAGFILMRIIRLYPAYIIALFGYLLIKPKLDEQWLLILVQHGLLLLTVTSKSEVFYFNPPFWCIPSFVEFFIFFAFIRDRYDPVKLFTLSFAFVITMKLTSQGAPEWLRLHFPYYAYAFFLGGVIQKVCSESVPWPWWLPPPGVAAILCVALVVGLGSLFEWIGEARLAELPGWRFYHELCVFLHGGTLLCLLYTPWKNGQGRFLTEIARAGFSIYLFHILILREVQLYLNGISGLLVAIILTIGLAVAIQRMIENPIRRWGKRLGQRFLAPSHRA
ncbi:MAG TPA: acyltransferase family protein [Candidatus Competibacteraceae bacterium]|nr:acyltransferase family protein [Candidatus Competibacteraceae bacterium]